MSRQRTGAMNNRAAYVWAGVAVVVAGVVIFPLPGPMGTPIILFGLALIVAGNRRAASRLRLARRTRPRFHALLTKLEGRLRPGPVRDGLARTRRR